MQKNISQSLAGRVGVTKLMPLSYHELSAHGIEMSAEKFILKGGYPRLYDAKIDTTMFYKSYTSTYLDKDVNQVLGVRDIAAFNKFLSICATEIGQLLNVSSLASRCGIKVDTANSWLSVLEASYIIVRLQPYFANIGKRITKTPKLYFVDTGLACSLLNINTKQELRGHKLYGSLFENMVVSEFIKDIENRGKAENLYFWRDSNKNEVDLIVDDGELHLYEVKSSETAKHSFSAVMNSVYEPLGAASRTVIYGGEEQLTLSGVEFIPWQAAGAH
jgi:predicted AAA+ superfamily ATPase